MQATRAGRSASLPPLVVLTVGLLSGQLLAGGCMVATTGVAVALAAAGLLAAVWRPVRLLAMAALVAVWGNWSTARQLWPALPHEHIATYAKVGRGDSVALEATVAGDPSTRDRQIRLVLETTRSGADGGWHPVFGSILLTVRDPQRAWLAGDTVRARLALRRPRNFGNPGEFDYEAYLARRGLYVTAFLADDAALELVDRVPDSPWLIRWRRGVGALINDTLPPPEREVLRALIIGDAAAVPAPLQRAFVNAGVNHVLSISGLHVGMVAAIGYALWRWLLGRSRWLLLRANVPKLSVTAGAMFVLLYAGIAGSNPATLRSVIMVLVFVGGVLVNRQRDFLVSLAAAALLISLIEPGAVLDVSFQLSFVAVLFLVLMMTRFARWWRHWEDRHLVRLRRGVIRWLRPAAAYLAVSASALVGTAPLTAFHFNQVSWIALLANAVVVPLLGTVAVACGLAAALLFPVSTTLARAAVIAAWPGLWLGDRAVELFAAVPHAALRIVSPTVFELGLLYGALLTALCVSGRARRAGLGLISVLALADGSWWYWERMHHRDLRVTFLSVGQGDSAVVECPPDTVMVIDGGGVGDGSFDVGERLIAPYLWSRKIAGVDIMAMSHPQWDHYGGLTFVAREFAPREFWSTGDVAATSVHFAALQAALDEGQVARVTLTANMQRHCGDVLVRVLSPAAAKSVSVNDRSLVLQLEYAGRRVLFPGDIERDAEAAIVAATDGQLTSAILKVPHHGSATSSTPAFVAAVAPRWAVASVGLANRFGFPHVGTLRTYAEHAVKMLRTDLDGAVTTSIDVAGRTVVQTHRRRDPRGGAAETLDDR